MTTTAYEHCRLHYIRFTLPVLLSSPAAAIIEGEIYVAGGSANGRSVQADMWVRIAP